MNTRYVGSIAAGALVAGAMAWNAGGQTPVSGEAASAASGAAGLITHVHDIEGKPVTVLVVEPHKRVLAVYHVDRDTGEIKPKSIRNLHWDLQMQEFNSPDLSPSDIKTRLERRGT